MADIGEVHPRTCGEHVARYKYFDRAGFERLVHEQLGDAEFLSRVRDGVDGIGDGDGNPPSAQAQREAVIGDLALSAAAVRAFVESLAGAGAKNSKPSRGR